MAGSPPSAARAASGGASRPARLGAGSLGWGPIDGPSVASDVGDAAASGAVTGAHAAVRPARSVIPMMAICSVLVGDVGLIGPLLARQRWVDRGHGGVVHEPTVTDRAGLPSARSPSS